MNYSTTVSLRPEDNNRFQAVYAGQRYGTFHGVFSKFNIKKEGEKTFLHDLDLELINYKGLLNISLKKGSKIDVDAKEKNRNLSIILLKINVEAKTGEANTTDKVILKEPFEVKDNIFFSIVCDLLPMNGVLDEKKAFTDNVFDEEFFYRDGLVFQKREVTDIPLEKKTNGGDKLGFDFESFLLPKNDRFSSIRCRVGNSKIII